MHLCIIVPKAIHLFVVRRSNAGIVVSWTVPKSERPFCKAFELVLYYINESNGKKVILRRTKLDPVTRAYFLRRLRTIKPHKYMIKVNMMYSGETYGPPKEMEWKF